MYTKKLVLSAIDEYLSTEGYMSYYEIEPMLEDAKEYYSIKLADLDMVDNNLVTLVSYLEEELGVEADVVHYWKTINDICNTFRWKIKNREELV